MIVGVPKEIKNHEYRVGLIPAAVKELVASGHRVIVETNAGDAIGFSDAMYITAGAEIISHATDIFQNADFIVKVKEPQTDECKALRPNQILFTYLHLAADAVQAQLLINSNAICIAYETVTNDHGGLPLLAPMSEVAGKMSIQAGAHHLEKAQGGNGTLLGGVPGVSPGKVVILGGGVVGTNAAKVAIGMGADVYILDQSLDRLRQLDDLFGNQARCLYSNSEAIEHYVCSADLVVGAVLIPGASAPKLISKQLVNKMKKGAVLVDVAIDQGGCFETSIATTHHKPTYLVDDVVHYCVANIPGAVARTSTIALNNATLSFVLNLANSGYKQALLENTHLCNGLNIYKGLVTHKAVSDSLTKLESDNKLFSYIDPIQALNDQSL